MKKIFLNEMETERRNELIKKNEKLLYLLRDDFMNMLSYQQEDVSYYAMGKDWHRYIESHDHYDSFFLTLKDWRTFINNIESDYLNTDALKLYNEIIKNDIALLEKYEDDDKRDEIEETIEQKAKIILKDIENLLHEYEETPEDDDVIQYADEMEQLNEYYIEEHEDGFCDGVIRRDISYTETFI